MTPDTLTIHTESIGEAKLLAPQGDVDLSRSPALRNALRQAQTSKPPKVIIDLAGVDYMDSSGVATLVEALQIARRNNTKIVLCALSEKVRSILEIARLDTVFMIKPTRADAAQA